MYVIYNKWDQLLLIQDVQVIETKAFPPMFKVNIFWRDESWFPWPEFMGGTLFYQLRAEKTRVYFDDVWDNSQATKRLPLYYSLFYVLILLPFATVK